jgi:hypothetical protein
VTGKLRFPPALTGLLTLCIGFIPTAAVAQTVTITPAPRVVVGTEQVLVTVRWCDSTWAYDVEARAVGTLRFCLGLFPGGTSGSRPSGGK